MNKIMKRALAVSAVAPFALIGLTGSAGAAVAFPSDYTKVGNVITGTCEHPDFDADPAPDGLVELGFQVQIILEGTGAGSDQNDIEEVRVTATTTRASDPGWTPTPASRR